MELSEWKKVLLPQEIEALEYFGCGIEWYGIKEISPDEAFEAIVSWNGGLASTSEIKGVIRRVYGISL